MIEALGRLRNTRYHDRPVSLYGGMVELPLIVTRDDGARMIPVLYPPVYTLRLELLDIEPSIWRRIHVPGSRPVTSAGKRAADV